MLLNLTHYDDGKQKYRSHEVELNEPYFYNAEHDVYTHNPFSITGYGQTKEEAVEDFKKKYEYVLNELIAFGKMLFETDVIEIMEVDCCGYPIDKGA